MGTYSGPKAQACTDCPIGTYSPSTGLADQAPGDANPTGPHCLLCPEGSLAVRDGAAASAALALVNKATECSACPAGTFGAADATLACQPCAANTYRSGDASPENNECRPVPAGYKADAAAGATTITACTKGSVAYWAAGARVPPTPTDCQPCGAAPTTKANTYAPREGMAACLPCRGGAVPKDSDGAAGTAAAGPDTCEQCPAGTFRSFYTEA